MKSPVLDFSSPTQILSSAATDDFNQIKLCLDEASYVMEILQTELDRIRTQEHAHRRNYLKSIRHLNRVHRVLPCSMYLDGLTRESSTAVAGGGFADVWIGRLDKQRVCIKVLRFFQQGSDRTELIKALSTEVLLWRQLHHPNILPFLGINSKLFSPSFCIISPWMSNGDIMAYARTTSLDLGAKLQHTIQIAEGLLYLHSLDPPVVHGDIKGGNILISDDYHCCLADFGLAVLDTQSMNPTLTATVQGSLRWLAPEFINPTPTPTQGKLTSRDIYAFGCTVFEILTGQPPFSHLNLDIKVAIDVLKGIRPVLPSLVIPEEDIFKLVRSLLDSCWAEDIVERPDAQNVCDCLQHISTLLHITEVDLFPLNSTPDGCSTQSCGSVITTADIAYPVGASYTSPNGELPSSWETISSPSNLFIPTMPTSICHISPKPYATPPASPPARPMTKFPHSSSPSLSTNQQRYFSTAMSEEQGMADTYLGTGLPHEAKQEVLPPYTHSKPQNQPSFMDMGANTDATQPTPLSKALPAISSSVVPCMTKTDSPFCLIGPQFLSPWTYQLTPEDTGDLARKELISPHSKRKLQNDDDKTVWDSRPQTLLTTPAAGQTTSPLSRSESPSIIRPSLTALESELVVNPEFGSCFLPAASNQYPYDKTTKAYSDSKSSGDETRSQNHSCHHVGPPAVQHSFDDTALKETSHLSLCCFNCHITKSHSWHQSISNPGRMLCDRCSLDERAHSTRPRPLRFQELKAGQARMGNGHGTVPSLAVNSTSKTFPQTHQARSLSRSSGPSGSATTRSAKSTSESRRPSPYPPPSLSTRQRYNEPYLPMTFNHGYPGSVNRSPMHFVHPIHHITPVVFVEESEEATCLTDRVHWHCFNCGTSDTRLWRRSKLDPGKVLCNRCALLEGQFKRRGMAASNTLHLRSPTMNQSQSSSQMELLNGPGDSMFNDSHEVYQSQDRGAYTSSSDAAGMSKYVHSQYYQSSPQQSSSSDMLRYNNNINQQLADREDYQNPVNSHSPGYYQIYNSHPPGNWFDSHLSSRYSTVSITAPEFSENLVAPHTHGQPWNYLYPSVTHSYPTSLTPHPPISYGVPWTSTFDHLPDALPFSYPSSPSYASPSFLLPSSFYPYPSSPNQTATYRRSNPTLGSSEVIISRTPFSTASIPLASPCTPPSNVGQLTLQARGSSENFESHMDLQSREQLQLFMGAISLPYSPNAGPFIPQLLYKPHITSDRRRDIEKIDFEKPIYFWMKNPIECGIPLSDALHSHVTRLLHKDQTVFQEGKRPSVSIKLEWPGYHQWSRQIPTTDYMIPPRPITKAKLAKNIAKCVQRFISERQNHQLESESDARWRVGSKSGDNSIKFEDLILVSMHHVSVGSWQPQLRLKSQPITPTQSTERGGLLWTNSDLWQAWKEYRERQMGKHHPQDLEST